MNASPDHQRLLTCVSPRLIRLPLLRVIQHVKPAIVPLAAKRGVVLGRVGDLDEAEARVHPLGGPVRGDEDREAHPLRLPHAALHEGGRDPFAFVARVDGQELES